MREIGILQVGIIRANDLTATDINGIQLLQIIFFNCQIHFLDKNRIALYCHWTCTMKLWIHHIVAVLQEKATPCAL